MTASEKLRALTTRGDLPWTTKERMDALLPLIADVVEAAERELPPEGHHRLCEFRNGGECDCYMRRPLLAALTALRNHLDDVT